MKNLLFVLCLITLLPARMTTAQAVAPEQAVRCHVVSPLPGTIATEADQRTEANYCAIDFASPSVALCPKLWSTSPAMLVYDLVSTQWADNAAGFEAEICARGTRARKETGGELAMFKNSVNGRETSGTFAPASLLYYHLSRLLQTRLQVPVSVVAEFPVGQYRQRVVLPGLRHSKDSTHLKMLYAGWMEMDGALSAPQAYADRRELFTADGASLWGVLLMNTGRRYGPEMNGTRVSGWGDGQNRDFQKTAPFIALRTDLPLAEAISAAVTEARLDPALAEALPAEISLSQVAWWMGEVSEIVLLDTILRQQDRIGNIDYEWQWLWADEGVVKRSKRQPESQHAVRIRTSWLNDNDAGVRNSYANYAQRTSMLDDWHHMAPGLYRRLQLLAQDLALNGEVARAIRQNYRLSSSQAEGVIRRAMQAAAQLRKRCQQKLLRFDLSPAATLLPHKAVDEAVDCNAPGPATP